MSLFLKRSVLLFACALAAAPVLAAVDQPTYDQVTTEAKRLINGGQVDAGIKVMRDRIKKEPNEGAWPASLGEYLIQLSHGAPDKKTKEKYLKDAEKVLSKGAKLFRKEAKPAHEAQCYYYLGGIELLRGNMEKAKNRFKQTLSIHPSHEGALEGMKQYGDWRLRKSQPKAAGL